MRESIGRIQKIYFYFSQYTRFQHSKYSSCHSKAITEKINVFHSKNKHYRFENLQSHKNLKHFKHFVIVQHDVWKAEYDRIKNFMQYRIN